MKQNKKGIILSLGAGENQVPFIRAAMEKGFTVLAVDLKDNAPGFSFSKYKIVESITEYRKIFSHISSLTLAEPIIGIGCRSYGKAIESLSYLSEKLELPGNPLSIIKNFYDKSKIKKYLSENGINVPQQINPLTILNKNINPEAIPFPLIYKPIDGSSKKGIKIIENINDFKKVYKNKQNIFLEEFIDGKEFTVLGFVFKSKFYIVSVSDKLTTNYPPYLEIAHVLPTRFPNFIGEIKLIMQRIINLTGLSNGALVGEFKSNSRGDLYLMEVMPEIGGEFLADILIPKSYNYNYFYDYINVITGIEPKLFKNLVLNNNYNVIQFVVPPEGSHTFSGFREIDSKKNNFFFEKELLNIGTHTNTELGNKERVKVVGYSTSKEEIDLINQFKIGNTEAIFEKHESNME
jgi:biotin carboxylase